MKILLTGQPHSGKTTLINALLSGIRQKQGFVTREIPDPVAQGARVGFELVDMLGRSAVLAHVDIPSEDRVSKYGVNVSAFEAFLVPLSKVEKGKLLYIDEIGKMELFSYKFKGLVATYLNAGADFIGTITSVYDDDFVDQLKTRGDIEVIEVTVGNRDKLLEDLRARLKTYQG